MSRVIVRLGMQLLSRLCSRRGNCRAIFKDGEKAVKYFSECAVAVTLAFGVLARRDRRARKGRLRTKRLSSGLSVPLAMACRPTRQILQYRALGLRHGRRPASLSSLTRLQSANSVQATVTRRAKALSAAGVDPGLAPVRQTASGAFLRLLRVRCAPRHDCSIFSGWRDQSQVRIRHDLRAPRDSNCSNNRHFMNGHRTERAAGPALKLRFSTLAQAAIFASASARFM